MLTLLERLAQPGVLIADGATGTQLQKAGLKPGTAPELWNLENPDAIRNLHRSYIEAGADIVLTNTFGGNAIKLGREGLGGKMKEINQRAAALAREVANGKAYVFGDIGPTGNLLKPYGPMVYEEAVEAFADQAAALEEGGADAILIETMSDLNEAKAAVEGAKKSVKIPVLITMSFDTRGRTMMGIKPSQAVKELWAMGVAVVGANCGRTLTETLTAIQEMRQTQPDAVLMAKPNAGLPRLEGDQSVYDVDGATMAEYALKFRDAGVKIMGGCCGSNPDHIRAIAKALK